MCGIVGVFGNITVPLENVFKQLLVVDQLRGAHSTGMFAVRRHVDEVAIAKAVGTPAELMDTKTFDKAMGGIHRVLIGHNRYATQGAVNKSNAHPFEFDKVVGVHNGSLTAYTGLDGYGQHPVDSHVLYNHINKHGLKDAVSKTGGAMALVWWDKHANELNVYRNNERPLFYGVTKLGAIILGSEFGMVDWICDRNGIELDALEAVPVNQHMRFGLAKGTIAVNKPVAELVEKPVVAHFTSFHRGTAPINGSANDKNGNEKSYHYTNVHQIETIPNVPKVQRCILNNTGEIYEVIAKGKILNVDGVFCKSDDFPQESFFVYTPASAPEIKIGDFLQADVAGFNPGINGKGNYFLKLDTLTHFPADDPPAAAQAPALLAAPAKVEVEDEEADPVGGGMFLSPSGREMEPKDWLKRYGTCCHCSADAEYDTAVSLPSRDAVLCDECASNPVVRDSLCV